MNIYPSFLKTKQKNSDKSKCNHISVTLVMHMYFFIINLQKTSTGCSHKLTKSCNSKHKYKQLKLVTLKNKQVHVDMFTIFAQVVNMKCFILLRKTKVLMKIQDLQISQFTFVQNFNIDKTC